VLNASLLFAYITPTIMLKGITATTVITNSAISQLVVKKYSYINKLVVSDINNAPKDLNDLAETFLLPNREFHSKQYNRKVSPAASE
jgi:hypothetical protein